MKTHTIALWGDWLIATAPDGDTATLAERIADAKSQGIDFDDDDLRIITGLAARERTRLGALKLLLDFLQCHNAPSI